MARRQGKGKNTTPFFSVFFCVTRIASAQFFGGVGAESRMSQPSSAIELSSDSEGAEDGSDTQSEDGLREQNALARGASGSDDDVGQIPVPLADRAAARASVHSPPANGASKHHPMPTDGSCTKGVQKPEARGANASDDELLHTPVPLAARAAAQAGAHSPPTVGASMRQPTPTQASGTKSVGGQSNHSGRSCDADASDGDVLSSKFPLAARAALQTPPTIAAPRRQLTPTKRPAPRMPSLNADSDDDGAQPKGTSSCTVQTPRGSASPALERPEREHQRSSGAARRRRTRDAAVAGDVDGLAALMADLGGLVGSMDPFAVDRSTSDRLLADLEAAVRRTSIGGLRHTPGITRTAKWIGTVDPTGVVKSLLSAYDLAYDDLDVTSMQLALDRLNEHASVAHGRYSAEKAFLKTAVTNASKLERGLLEEHMGYAVQGAMGLYDSGHTVLPEAVARRLLNVARAGVADTVLIGSLRADPRPSTSLDADAQPTWPDYLRSIGLDGASQLEQEVALKVTEQPTSDQMKITRLFELFLTERLSSIVLGMSGVGKTYMAPVWKLIAELKGKKVYFVGPNVEARAANWSENKEPAVRT